MSYTPPPRILQPAPDYFDFLEHVLYLYASTCLGLAGSHTQGGTCAGRCEGCPEEIQEWGKQWGGWPRGVQSHQSLWLIPGAALELDGKEAGPLYPPIGQSPREEESRAIPVSCGHQGGPCKGRREAEGKSRGPRGCRRAVSCFRCPQRLRPSSGRCFHKDL